MKRINAILISLLFVGYSLNVPAQTMNNMNGMKMPTTSNMIQKAICILYPTQGNNVTGTITFTKSEGGINVAADLQGLTPGKHGIHIHEYGDISSTDGSSAGGHFNPTSKMHGSPMGEMHHEGDLGNIEADSSGKAHLEFVDKSISFMGMTSIIGRSVVVHKGVDDMTSQPAGNSGPRVAVGVIGIAK